MGGGDDDVDASSRDVQRIDRHHSCISARRTRLLVDDDADAIWQTRWRRSGWQEEWLTG